MQELKQTRMKKEGVQAATKQEKNKHRKRRRRSWDRLHHQTAPKTRCQMSETVNDDPKSSFLSFAPDLIFCVAAAGVGGSSCAPPPFLMQCWRAFFSARSELLALRNLPLAT